MVRWLTITLGLLALLCANALAQSPTISITCSAWIADYDSEHPGEECRIVYNIDNSSPLGDINNMITFTLPAGLDAGVYDAFLGLGLREWATSFGADNSTFDGTGYALASGESGRIELYSTCLSTRLAYATAEAQGIGNSIPFTPVLVEVPTELEPPQPGLGSVSVGSNQVSLGLVNLWTNYHYTVEQSVDMAGWTNAGSFWALGASTNWTATFPTNAPAQFYRLRSP